ncbi:MAG: dienelactone hydrolase, partial [Burkholderiales bacterium]|nr:dienelactone hydrolase [Burkholderiales bacterium]
MHIPLALKRFFLVSLSAVAHVASAAPGQEVQFNSLDGTRLRAWLFLPDTQGPATRPAVIAMHGCGGLYAKGGKLNARHQAMADMLLGQGYAVLFPDSLTSRGEDSL